jgi:hypothetical protein
LLKVVAAEPQGVLVHFDATHAEANQDGSNPSGGQASQAIGRTCGGLNTKVTALVDSKGRAVQLVVDSGNQADIRCADRIEIPSGHRLGPTMATISPLSVTEYGTQGAVPASPT